MPLSRRLLISLFLLPSVVSSFQIPQQILQHTAIRSSDFVQGSSVSKFGFLLSDATITSPPTPSAVAAAAATVGIPNPDTFFNGNVGDHIGEGVKNIAFGVTAVVFLFAGLTYIAAAVLVPAGAQQLEIECTAIIPDTWNEYLGKLEEGQEMKNRPDLMFELGLLLNKSKADRLKQVCVELKLAPDLWSKYQDMLAADQELQDRPELIAGLNTDVGQRAAQILRENTNICPETTWESYEKRTDNDGKQPLADRPDLLDDLARELGYSDLLAAVAACLGGVVGVGEQQQQQSGDAVIDVETISGITEVRRKDNQWDEDDK
jgi:hypothetical protein